MPGHVEACLPVDICGPVVLGHLSVEKCRGVVLRHTWRRRCTW